MAHICAMLWPLASTGNRGIQVVSNPVAQMMTSTGVSLPSLSMNPWGVTALNGFVSTVTLSWGHFRDTRLSKRPLLCVSLGQLPALLGASTPSRQEPIDSFDRVDVILEEMPMCNMVNDDDLAGRNLRAVLLAEGRR